MIKKIFKFYFSNPHSNFKSMIAIVILLGLLELFGIGVFVPLLDKSNQIITNSINIAFKYINIENTEINLLIFIFLIFLLKFILTVIFNRKLSFFMNQLVYKTRLDIVKKISNVKYGNFRGFKKGELNNIITKESEKISEGYIYILQIILKSMLSVIYIYLSALVSYKSSIIAISIGFVFVYALKNLSSLSVRYSSKLLISNESLNNIFGEFLRDFKRLMATNTSGPIVNKVKDDLKKYSNSKFKLDFYGKLAKEIPLPVGAMVIVCIMVINNLYVHESSMAVLISSFFLYRTFSYITNVQYAFQKLMAISASIIKIIDMPASLERNKEVWKDNHLESIDSLEFVSASHFYAKNSVLRDINLHLEKGKRYVVLGASGSGKTTLINKLLMLSDSATGDYKINGMDSNELNRASFRNLVSYVSQDSLFYYGSIRDNVTLFNPDGKIGLDDIIRKSCLDLVVEQNGLDRILDDTKLSGGQIQRIAIAREMIKPSNLIIFDEATSSLDSTTSDVLMDNFNSEFDSSIFMMVTHNLISAMKFKFDKIIFIDDGVLEVENSFLSCYKKHKNFKKMCNNQNIKL